MTGHAPAAPRLYDQTLRDGLGMAAPLSPGVKAELTRRLVESGIDYLEVVRFPRADDYPQFHDAAGILDGVAPYRERATIAVFGMGEAGIDEALDHAELFDELHIPCFASSAYAAFALGETWPDSLRRLERAAKACSDAGVRLTVGLGTAFGCPLDPAHDVGVTPARVADIVGVGAATVMLGDTAGQATPPLVRRVLAAIDDRGRPGTVRVHFHDTFGRALLNTWEAITSGVDGVDASLLGVGGEPYPYFLCPDRVNNGNCATEEVGSLLAAVGALPGRYVLPALNDTARWLSGRIAETVFGRASFAELVPLPDE